MQTIDLPNTRKNLLGIVSEIGVVRVASIIKKLLMYRISTIQAKLQARWNQKILITYK